MKERREEEGRGAYLGITFGEDIKVGEVSGGESQFNLGERDTCMCHDDERR